MSKADLDRMDAPLIALANQSGGDLRKLMFMFFSFLHRRTDFYVVHHEDDIRDNVPIKMGFKEGDAEKMLLAAFRQFPLRKMPRQGGGGPGAGVGGGGATPTTNQQPKKQATAPPAKAESKVKISSTATKRKGSDEIEEAMRKVRLTEEGKQIPVGNGGSTSRYQWTQTIEEVTVATALPEGTKGKDLDIVMKTSSLSVKMKRPAKEGEEPATILEGALSEKIRMDESTWSLEGGVLLLTLEKSVKTWWKTVLEGDDEIDTDMVDSTRHISSYEEQTQGMIRKCLFDQRQERMGLPSSDEILGKKPLIPTLPSGVEYIDKKTLDDADASKEDGDGSGEKETEAS
jgi:HSP20 family molecular chaperone IbpA